MADRQRVSDRLMSREQGLSRRQMPGGGEAYSGPLASQALQTLGARAMTMDSSIFVQDGFDASKPEDLALYAHEAHHQSESGGSDNHGAYDGEEQAARARERMVLHQAKSGMDAAEILMGLKSNAPKNAAEADKLSAVADSGPGDGSGESDSMKAYRNMIRDGMGHAEVVRNLADYVVQTLERQESEQGLRSGGQSKLK